MNFKHRTALQIRFKDIDSLGHVNNANHLTYCEISRVKYFTDVIGENINWSKRGIILAKAVLDYKHPILLNDLIFVQTKCSRIGNKSFDLSYSIIKELNGQQTEMMSALTTMVCFDYSSQKTIKIPDEWRKKMVEFEDNI